MSSQIAAIALPQIQIPQYQNKEIAAALRMLSENTWPVPMPRGSKGPNTKAWQEFRATPDDAEKFHGKNIGILLGIGPKFIADVDLDCPEAVAAASIFPGPATNRISGHKTNPYSHLFYETPTGFITEQFEDCDEKMLVELRGQAKSGSPQQTVVPPSIHPDTGNAYEWYRCGDYGLATVEELRTWVSRIAAAALLARCLKKIDAWHQPTLAVAGTLAVSGWGEADIITFIKAVTAGDPNPRDRETEVRSTFERAARGESVTQKRAMVEFFGQRVVSKFFKWLNLKDSAVATKNAAGIICSASGKPLAVLANAITQLREISACVAFDEFALRTMIVQKTPWGTAEGVWTDLDDARACEWAQHRDVLVDVKTAAQAIQVLAEEQSFHPVKDYLNSLVWDKKPRVDTWLTTYLGVERSEFAAAAGRRWLISAIARIFEPGCQADHTLLLEGPQGIRKSTALRALAGPEWFTDHLSDFSNKDSRIELHGVWIVELAELASIKRSQSEKVKSFLTAASDHFRLPYGRRAVHVPRTNVFAGTTNDATPFSDETGNRRFWPVKCGSIDTSALGRDRDQLWAEAFALYRSGERWWLDTEKLNKLASEEQDARYEPGVWDEMIVKWLHNPTSLSGGTIVSSTKGVTVTEVLIHAIRKEIEHCTQADQNQVARCLKHQGWKRKQCRQGAERVWFYVPPEEWHHDRGLDF